MPTSTHFDVPHFDVIVIGAGIFGSAAALELATRGRRVAVIDRLGSGHPATSSTGASRSIRVAYDHPFYVRLALDAIERWRKLEAQTGRPILHLTGQVDLGPVDKLAELARTIRGEGVGFEVLDPAGLARHLPELAILPGEAGLFHAQGGTVMAEHGLLALTAAARAAGVVTFAPERVIRVETSAPVRIETDHRVFTADVVVVAAGPWSGALLSSIGIDLPLAPAIAQVTFLDAPALVGRPGIAEWQSAGDGGIYGHPVPGIGYKIAFDAGAAGWDPDVELWEPDAAEEERILAWLRARLPGFPRHVARTQRHPWTMTPDADFILDRRGSVVLACGCSGHAFKFGPALGPLVADLVDGSPPSDLTRLDRPGLKRPAPSPSAPIIR